MKEILLPALLISALPSFGQLLVGDVNVNLISEVHICEVVIREKLMSKDIDVTFEYGQPRKAERYVIDRAKKKNKEFETIAEVINFMENEGWAYVNSYTYYAQKESPMYRYYFKRKPDNKSLETN
jgi:hypothetical protein